MTKYDLLVQSITVSALIAMLKAGMTEEAIKEMEKASKLLKDAD